VGATIWYWVGKQVLIVLQIRLEVAVCGDTWYSTPNSQRIVDVDEEAVVVVVVVVVTVTHTRSDVAVGATVCTWYTPQVLNGEQTRSDVAVGATLWYWYTVHTVRGMHTRLDVLV